MVGDVDHAAAFNSRSRSKCDADLVCVLPVGVVSGVAADPGSGDAAAAALDARCLLSEGPDRLVAHVSLRASLLAGSEESRGAARARIWFAGTIGGSDPDRGGAGGASGEDGQVVDCWHHGGGVHDYSASGV